MNACGHIIAFVGADGCGKSTLARIAAEECDRIGVPANIVWSRFNNYLSKPLLALARCTGHNRREVHDGVVFGYHDFRSAVFFRFPFIFLQAIDVNLAAAKKMRRLARQPGVIICERSAWDTLSDVILDTGLDSLADNAWGRLITASIRGSGPVLWINRSRDAILRSRPELKHDRMLNEKIALYERLAVIHGWHKIDNNRPLDQTRDDVRNWMRRLVT